MLQNITLGQFFPGQSILHRLDPRTKIILLFVLMILIFVVEGWTAYFALTALTVGLIFISKVPNRFKISQAAQLDNFIYVANSFRQPRRRSFSEILRVQSDDGGNFIWRANKFATGAVNCACKFVDVHDFAA